MTEHLSRRLKMPILFCAFLSATGLGLVPQQPLDRRTAFRATVTAGQAFCASLCAPPHAAKAATSSTAASSSIAARLDAPSLTMPPPSRASELNGVDNTYNPPWLAGTWDVTQTLTNVETPLGLKYVGGPAGSESIASEVIKEQRLQIGVPISLKLRWVPTKFGVAEDRLFNSRERLNAFAGRTVVASVEYSNLGGSNRASVLAMGGTEDDPLQTTVVRFKGPAAQKTFLVAHGQENFSDGEGEGENFACYELLRSIFALTNQSTAPPVTTDTENIWSFQRVDENNVLARLRIASYLNAQSDSLYFEARNRAVSFADYTLTMKRLS